MIQSTYPSAPIAVTAGEPAGIGPDLVVTLAASNFHVPFIAIGNAELFSQRAAHLGLSLKVRKWHDTELFRSEPGTLVVSDIPLGEAVEIGSLNTRNADYVLKSLDVAIDGALANRFSAVVTGPVHKGVINDAGHVFSGHTEHFQHRCGVHRVVMMLASSRMKVALATTHLPLKDVSASITQESLTEVLSILIADLKSKFGCPRPRILVAGLNPHAGEGGHMGMEEIEVIEPVIAALSDGSAELIGPLPADTLFTPKYLQDADAALAMFHDQGLPVLKYDGFGEAINITLGLPIIRTSVDHGTALDIAGSGKADTGSLKCALELALKMALSRE